MKEIRVYVEGGGDYKETRRALRLGFQVFLGKQQEKCRERRLGWSVILCGGREDTIQAFERDCRLIPEALCLLLVDSEGPVTKEPWQHLKQLDLLRNHKERCCLMVQLMESWFIADVETLKKHYGQDFNESQISKRKNVEEIPKDDALTSLKNATKKSQKGEYKKRHASDILEKLNPEIVRSRAPHCETFLSLLEKAAE